MALDMEPRQPRAEDEVLVDINTTPLIDVMLVLLIMLIVTIPVQTHAVKLDMPDVTAPAPAEPPPVINVEVDFDGTVIWNGKPLSGREALARRLRREARNPQAPEIHIRPNKLAEYQHVATLLAMAQRLGIRKIGIVGNERFMP